MKASRGGADEEKVPAKRCDGHSSFLATVSAHFRAGSEELASIEQLSSDPVGH